MFGSGDEGSGDHVERFEISVAEDVLEDLRGRLERSRIPRPLRDADWSYGTNLSYLAELCEYWRERFDWRRTEALLNRFDQFQTRIDGIEMHFVHQRSPNESARPLLLLHGWPSCTYEFHRVIEPLVAPSAGQPAFHVVCPSLPGYGWSEAPTESGWDLRRMGDAFASLMARLGYSQYGVQGGDWGALIATEMGRKHREAVSGIHLSMVLVRPPTDPDAGVSVAEHAALRKEAEWLEQEMAYDGLQSTKPDTLAPAVNDSPAGLASWIVEKLRAWSDCGGDIERRFSKDDILSLVTIYWVTETIASSMRLYREYSAMNPRFGTDGYIDIPTACAVFPGDIYHPPRAWVEERYDLRRWTLMPRGGHFAALEEPTLLVDDVRAFFGTRDVREPHLDR